MPLRSLPSPWSSSKTEPRAIGVPLRRSPTRAPLPSAPSAWSKRPCMAHKMRIGRGCPARSSSVTGSRVSTRLSPRAAPSCISREVGEDFALLSRLVVVSPASTATGSENGLQALETKIIRGTLAGALQSEGSLLFGAEGKAYIAPNADRELALMTLGETSLRSPRRAATAGVW